MKFKLSQAGDTIVEVLIAVTVLSLALGGAYATANRSSKNVQANKERYQAQLIANSQAERIRANISTKRSSYTGSSWCVLPNGVKTSTCSTNNGVLFNSNDLYQVKISCVGGICSSTDYNTYIIRIEWDSLMGGEDNVELYYGT